MTKARRRMHMRDSHMHITRIYMMGFRFVMSGSSFPSGDVRSIAPDAAGVKYRKNIPGYNFHL